MRLIIKQLSIVFDDWSNHYPVAGAVIELPFVYMHIHEHINHSFTISEKRQLQEIRSPKRQASRIAGRLAVRKALATLNPSVFNIHESSPIEIINNAHGMPYLTQHSNLHISISHSGSLAVALVSSCKIGVDIEKNEERPPSLTQCFFQKDEQQWINSTKTDQHQRLNALWTRKEAASKLMGVGGTTSFRKIPVLDNTSAYTFHTHTLNQYCISLAMERKPLL